MEGFTLIHDACGQLATLSYYEEETYTYDGECEFPTFFNRLVLTCDKCEVTVSAVPKLG